MTSEPRTSSPEAPAVTAVVMASRHRAFVRAAVDSVLAQTLAPGDFELVVVRDFEDPALDRYLQDAGVRSVRTPPDDIGPAIRAALTASRGRVLTFLDDDDRYRPERLAVVARAFEEDPELGFLRNGYAVIDQEGRPMPHHPFRAAERSAGARLGAVTVTAAAWGGRGPDWPPLGLDFNSSGMAVRRDLLDRFVAGRDLTGFRLLDALQFLAALAAPVSVRYDPRVLTEYRVHGQNISWDARAQDDPVAARGEFSRRSAPSYERLVEWARASGSPRCLVEAEGLRTVEGDYAALRDPATARSEFRRRRRELRGQGRSYLVRCQPLLPTALTLFAISPALGRWMYVRRLRSTAG